MNDDDIKKRLERAKSQSESAGDNTPDDILVQKILQEIGQLSTQVKDAEAHAESLAERLEKRVAEQDAVLQNATISHQRSTVRVDKLAKAQEAQAEMLSKTDAEILIEDRLSVFKAKCLTLVIVVGIAIGCYYVLQELGGEADTAPQKGIFSSEY